MTDHNWSSQQQRALREVSEWLKNPAGPQIYRLFGFAGTGKTTLAQHLAQDVAGITLFAAYTGKAASVLRKKGCVGASTLHSLMYTPSERSQQKLRDLVLQLEQLTKDKAPFEVAAECRAEIRLERERLKQPRFTLNEDSQIQSASLIVLDECSMVDRRIGEDLLSFRKKILVMGDPAQLPPIKGAGFFTNITPNLLLTEIHRQALDNPIIQFATTVREGGVIPFGDKGQAKKVRKADYSNQRLAQMSAGGAQLLCGKNETRRNLNKAVRKHLGRDEFPWPVKGERLVCLRNDKEVGVLNGVICEATHDAVVDPEFPESVTLSILYEGTMIQDLECDAEPFLATHKSREPQEKLGWDARRFYPMDLGYALTVHKAQGSQWDEVVVCDDGFGKRDPKQRQQWLYTAVTRAAERLVIVA